MAKEIAILEFDEKAAYNHDRPISSLIRTQLHHLHMAEHVRIPEKERTGVNINHLLTERQASEYIQKVTALLHKHGNVKSKSDGGKSKTRKKTAKKAAKPARSKGRGKTKKTKAAPKKRKTRK